VSSPCNFTREDQWKSISRTSACNPTKAYFVLHDPQQGTFTLDDLHPSVGVRPGRAFEEKGQVRGEGQPIDLRHEQSEAVLLDEVVQLAQVGFGEGGGFVHQLL